VFEFVAIITFRKCEGFWTHFVENPTICKLILKAHTDKVAARYFEDGKCHVKRFWLFRFF